MRLLSVLILLGMAAMRHAELPGNDPACESHSESMDQSARDDLSRVSH